MKIVLALLSVFTAPVISRYFVPPAGKCRDDIIPLAFDFKDLASLGRWNVPYGPDNGVFGQIVAEYKDLARIPNNVTLGLERFKLKDGSMAAYGYTYTYRDSILYEKSKGRRIQEFYNYALGFFAESNAVLYYRCSKIGVLGVDTRFIAIPRKSTLSKEGMQQLLNKDASFNFTGILRKY